MAGTKKILEKIFATLIFIFCFSVIIELGTNYCAFYCLFPIKNDKSYGYISKITGKTIIPLNKYHTRLQAQLMLPVELMKFEINDKTLIKSYDRKLGKFGYVDENDKVVIDYQFVDANEFQEEYAIVAIEKEGKKKYGTIDKKGQWIIQPKYRYLCPSGKYYTKACIDKQHCGIVDKFGNEITLMTYKTDRLECKKGGCRYKFCSIGKESNEVSCNYFL